MPASLTVFGMLEKALPLGAAGAEAWVPVDLAAGEAVMAALEHAPAEADRGLVYLRIESITGDLPTVLNVYVGLPEGATPAEHPECLAGNLGLYGLHQASRGGGPGMGFSLDVTKVFKRLQLVWPPVPARIRVSI